MTKALHLTDPYATHQPVLYIALKRTGGPVIEFGCGHGSTPLLHRYCAARQRELLTLETDMGWAAEFSQYVTPLHRFMLVDDWAHVLSDDRIVNRRWSVAFVDQAPWEARHLTLEAIKFSARFVVLHDPDYFPEHDMFGKVLAPLNGAADRGARDYGDMFKWWKEYFPLEPWPYGRTGPPTLLGSDFEPCDWPVNFAAYQNEEDFV